MATQKGGATGDKKGKKGKKNKPTGKKYKHYNLEGGLKRGKNCPRCGPGIFLANHKTRMYCGKCHYTEFIGVKDTKPSQ
jgi:ubiquitin-small subunit ribosomal protein S27Ae